MDDYEYADIDTLLYLGPAMNLIPERLRKCRADVQEDRDNWRLSSAGPAQSKDRKVTGTLHPVLLMRQIVKNSAHSHSAADEARTSKKARKSVS